MRRTLAVVAAAAVLTVPFAGGSPTVSAEEPTYAADSARAEAGRVLDLAEQLLGGTPAAARGAGLLRSGRELTLVLRDLDLARPHLSAGDRERADAMLARPTDRGDDPQRQGYTTRKTSRTCGGNVCVHYVRTTEDKAKPAWAGTTLRVMNKVWKREVGGLGYRRPLSDGGLPRSANGGNGKFDVYLKQLGDQGLYGYCAADFRLVAAPHRTGGYCVLDNDFSRAEYRRKPAQTLAVTAAHEFFHAIQFGYDYFEDRWFMESTATWMEERYADGVNDNRQYLVHGQVKVPTTPLDTFDQGGFAHYGNWPFWEFLSEKYGNGLVRSVWSRAASPKAYSTKALSAALKTKGGLPKQLAAFAAGNLQPGRGYPEGGSWPSADPSATWRFSTGATSRSGSFSVDHLASRSVLLETDPSLEAKGWRLRLDVDGPSRTSRPTAWLVVKNKKGGWTSKQVRLSRKGTAEVTLPFSSRKVRGASLTLVNASTRFRCGDGDGTYSCQGVPRDDGKSFAVRATLVEK